MAEMIRGLWMLLLLQIIHLATCDDDDWQTFSSKQYNFILDAERNSDETRNKASHACRRMNAFLLSIETQEEFDFIKHEIQTRVMVIGQEFAHEQWWTSGRLQLGKWIWNDDPNREVDTSLLKVDDLSIEDPKGDFVSIEFQHEQWALTATPRNFKLRYICEKGISFLPSMGQEGRLIKHLLSGYERDSRGSASDTTQVTLDLHIHHIHSLEQNILTTTSSLKMKWRDTRLIWHPLEHSNISNLVLRSNRLWTPSLEIVNGVGHDDLHKIHNDFTQVSYSGSMSRIVKSQFHTSCVLDLKYFPFDKHTCDITISAGMYNNMLVNITNRAPTILSEGQQPQISWQIMSTSVSHEEYSTNAICFNVILQRYCLYSIICLIVPLIVICLLSVLLWWIPLKGNDRTFCCLIIAAILTLFRGFISNIIPASISKGGNLTLVDIWLISLFILVLYTTSASVLLINMIDNISNRKLKQSICTRLIWKILPKANKIPLLPIPVKPHHKHIEEQENTSNELDILRHKLLYTAEKVGYCDGIQTTNIDEVELGTKKAQTHSSCQTEELFANITGDKIYAENFDSAIASVDKGLFIIYLILLSLAVAVILTAMIL